MRSAQTAGSKIALRFPLLSVCLFVRLHLSRVQYVTSYVTTLLQNIHVTGFWKFAGQATANEGKVVVCCLDGVILVGSRKDPVFVAYSY